MKNSSSKYTEGISYFNNEDYTNALNCLKKVSYLDLNYNYAVKYINESKKNNLFWDIKEYEDKYEFQNLKYKYIITKRK